MQDQQPAAVPAARALALPRCPAIVTRILAEARADDPDFNAIVRLLEDDPSMGPAFMAAVNTPTFGLPRKVSSIQAALMMLGLRNAAMLATVLALRQVFPKRTDPFVARFWTVSARHAALAAMAAQQLNAVPRDLAHTYVLFRDCGVLVLALADPLYVEMVRRSPGMTTGALMTIERRRFVHTDHREIGARLAEEWRLPDSVRWAIRNHHGAPFAPAASEVEQTGHRLVALGLLADWLGWGIDSRPDPEWKPAEPFVVATLGLVPAQLEKLRAAASKVAYAV